MADSTEPQAKPPPHEKRRQMIWLVLGFLTLMATLYASYRLTLMRQVGQRLDAIRADGYPATGDELDEWYEHVPDEENAALVLLDAYERLRLPEDRETREELGLIGDPPYPPPTEPLAEEWKRDMNSLLEDKAEAIERLHEGAAMERSRYPVDLSRGLNTRLPHLSDVRDTGVLLGLAAVVHAEVDRPKAAARSVQSVLGVAASVEGEPVVVSSQLIRHTVLIRAIDALEQVVHRTTLEDEALTEIMAALAEADRPDALLLAIAGERAAYCHAFSASADELTDMDIGIGPAWRILAYRLAGLADLDYATYLDHFNHVEAAERPTHERISALEAAEVSPGMYMQLFS